MNGRSDPADAVFTTTDAIALGLLEELRARGIGVPESVALVSHDGLFASSVATPALTTIVPPMHAMGRASVELLLRVIAGELPEPRNVLDAQLIVRESTIGLGVGARHGFATALSDNRAWAQWRVQNAAPAEGSCEPNGELKEPGPRRERSMAGAARRSSGASARRHTSRLVPGRETDAV